MYNEVAYESVVYAECLNRTLCTCLHLSWEDMNAEFLQRATNFDVCLILEAGNAGY